MEMKKDHHTSTDRRTTRNMLPYATHLYEFIRLDRQTKQHVGKNPNMATSSCVWCQIYMLGVFYCIIIGSHTAQDSWPSIEQRAAPTVWIWETRQNARFPGFNCRVSQYGFMFGKAHCKPYVWYAFSATSVTVINCTAPAHSHLIHVRNSWLCRSQWPRGLRHRSAEPRLLRLWVRIQPGAWMFVCCECCVLSGRGLCDGLITRPEESYRLWCVVVWSGNLIKNEEAMTRDGLQRHGGGGGDKKSKNKKLC